MNWISSFLVASKISLRKAREINSNVWPSALLWRYEGKANIEEKKCLLSVQLYSNVTDTRSLEFLKQKDRQLMH